MQVGVDIAGSFSGNLSNSAGRIVLERSLVPDLPDTTVPRVIADEVTFFDLSPWPGKADGGGKSLSRITANPSISGNDPDNWRDTDPNPGIYPPVPLKN